MNLPLPTESLQALESFLHDYFGRLLIHGGENENKGHFLLVESLRYSLFSGGKRFRPAIGFLLGSAMGLATHKVVPWLAAVECIHTYSLIHDDLPAMDNSATRRDKPTNHILFGEATALLAGDALLTEAFAILSRSYKESPDLGLQLTYILAQASGINGMVGGQALDLAANLENLTTESAELIHHLKTGALIRSVAEGLAVLARASDEDRARLMQFGSHLGFAFQLKDDLLDYEPEKGDPKNMVSHLGLPNTKDLLNTISRQAELQLQFLGSYAKPLLQLIEFNIHRSH